MSKKVKWVRQRQQCQCFTLKGEDFKARKKPFAIPWLITFSLVRNDSFLTGTLQLCLSKTFKEAVLRRQKWRTNWPFDCTQRPFEWGERRRKWSSGAGRGPWFLGRWTSPRDISVHTHTPTHTMWIHNHACGCRNILKCPNIKQRGRQDKCHYRVSKTIIFYMTSWHERTMTKRNIQEHSHE